MGNAVYFSVHSELLFKALTISEREDILEKYRKLFNISHGQTNMNFKGNEINLAKNPDIHYWLGSRKKITYHTSVMVM